MSTKKGFSLIEVVMALGLFMVLAGIGLGGFVSVLNQNRLAGEIIKANRLAEQGIEAARSIGNRDFSLLTNGTVGVGTSNNMWVFSGGSDVTDKFTRRIIVSTANRDVAGTLALSGTTDPDTRMVKSIVSWNFGTGDTRQFTLDTMLTNWRKAISAGGVSYNALTVYSNGTTVPTWKTYTTATNIFSNGTATIPAVSSGNPRNVVIRTSPKKTEAIMAIAGSNGTLDTYCFNGTSWSRDWSATIGGTATTRRFDVAYETNSGKAVVLYGTNTAATNEMAFRTKTNAVGCGSANWSSASNFDPARTSGTVHWVKLASDPRSTSNLIAAAWADSASDLSAAVWNTTTFANEPSAVTEASLEIVAAAQDIDDFDLAYESVSADLMLVWANSAGANGTNGVRYRLCTGATTTCTWGTVTTPPTWIDDATNLDLSANPNSDEMVFASIGNAGADLQIGYWSGVGWTNTANVDATAQTPLAGTKLVATGWLTSGATTRSVVTYNDSGTTNIGWYVGNRGSFAAQTDFTVTPVFANPQKWYEIAVNPLSKDRLMFAVSDNNLDYSVKRLVMTSTPAFTWTNSNGTSALEVNLGQATVKPFGFAFWQQ